MAQAIRGFDSRVFGLLLAGALSAASLPAAADDMFLKLDGIRGESVDRAHRDEIDIFSYSQSVTGPFARGTPSAGAAGKSVCGMVSILKYVDASSPDLILNALNGRHIPRAVITFRKAGQPFEYYKVTLDDVIIAEVEQSGGKNEPRASEKVTLMGRRFFYEYTQQNAQGGAGGKPKAGWDCVAASKA